MTNHYHLLIETQRFNRRHGRVGHVFQGRYKAILVERDRYLLELAAHSAETGHPFHVKLDI